MPRRPVLVWCSLVARVLKVLELTMVRVRLAARLSAAMRAA